MTDKLKNFSDHDLLIEVNTRLKDLLTAFNDLKDGTSNKILALEKGKADQKVVDDLQRKVNDDHEKRISGLEATRQDFREKLSNEKTQCKQRTDNLKLYLIFASMAVGALIAILVWRLTGFNLQ